MKVLMFGWELPPLYAGGIGMVCYDLLKELSNQNVEVTYLMPFGPQQINSDTKARVLTAESHVSRIKANIKTIKVPAMFTAYESPESYNQTITEQELTSGFDANKPWKKKALYGKDLFREVDLFAKRAYILANDLDFDVIHAHDWMTFPAAIGVADKTGKPLIVHIHNTIYDRYLGNASQHERDIEFNGMLRAEKIIAISHYVKNTIIRKYHIDPAKIEVVYNAPNTLLRKPSTQKHTVDITDNVVLFTGRITVQKGPEYFIQCAKKVLEKEPNTTFVMAGSGDMFNKMISLAADLGIGKNFLFTGFYNVDQAKALYSRADCYVMPSVSEPFGIVPLEAMDHGTPTIISKNSGCSEVLTHALKVDFWDTQEMANKVISVLRYSPLKEALSVEGQSEVQRMSWQKPTSQCINIYHNVRQTK